MAPSSRLNPTATPNPRLLPRAAKAPLNPDGRTPVHYFEKLAACGSIEESARVNFDDGFFDGKEAAHPGRFPPADSRYKEVDPAKIDRFIETRYYNRPPVPYAPGSDMP